MADNIKYRFIQNVGDYFPSGYFSDDFLDKVQKCAGLGADEVKSLCAPFVRLQQEYDEYKNLIINSSPRVEDAIRRTHEFNTRLLKILGYDTEHPYQEHCVVNEDSDPIEVIPVRHILRQGNQVKMLVMEMQNLITVGENEPAGLFEQQYESEPDRNTREQRYAARQWRHVYDLDTEKYKISPAIINKAITHIFLLPEERRPHFILMLAGNVVFLFDKDKWAKGSYLEFSLDELFTQARIPAFRNYYALFHMLVCKQTLAAEGEIVLMDSIIEESYRNAYEVTKDLKEGVILAVETLANEALYYWRQHDNIPVTDYTDDTFEGEVKDDCLTIIYRLLFLFYAESRTELEILPSGDEVYKSGYSLESLRDLEMVRLNSQESRDGYFFDESIRHLFRLLSSGHNMGLNMDRNKSFQVRPIDSPLFNDRNLHHLKDVRIRNIKWQEIIKALSLSKKKNYCGRISYANLGVNQLGSVYESLLAFRGFYAEEDYIEVHKADHPEDGTFLVPYSRMADFDIASEVLLDPETGAPQILPKGTFVYRLNGRDRQKSASYYTPEVLTRSTVKYTLKAIIDEVASGKRKATELLDLKILEPAMGAAAFQNEVINQLAEAYLTYQQAQRREAGSPNWRISPDHYRDELQKVKAYIATHNVYGVDLNPTAIELGKLSLWLNVIHKDMETPFFSNRLALGNAVVGAWLKVYSKSEFIAGKTTKNGKQVLIANKWWEKAPHKVRFFQNRVNRSTNEVYHFLLPDDNMLGVRSIAEQKKAHPAETSRMADLIKDWTAPVGEVDFARLQRLSRKIDYLLKEYFVFQQSIEAYTQNKKQIWGIPGDGTMEIGNYEEKQRLNDTRYRHDNAYFRLKMVMDYWCSLWFWEYADAASLPTRAEYWSDIEAMLDVSDDKLNTATRKAIRTHVDETGQTYLFGTPSGMDDMFNQAQLDGQVVQDGSTPEYEVKSDEDSELVRLSKEEILTKVQGKDRGFFDDSERFALVKKYADRYHFFHPMLEFLEVFWLRDGFDIICGNPPWLKLQFNEQSVISEKYPEVAIRTISAPAVRQITARFMENETLSMIYSSEEIEVACSSLFMNAKCNYALLEGQQTNLYKCVLSNSFSLVNSKGFIGLLHPDGIYDDSNGQVLRKEVYHRLQYHFQYVNTLKLFAEILHWVKFSTNVYKSFSDEINFVSINNLYHPSTIDTSFVHDGHGLCYGLKLQDGSWNILPHKQRIVNITRQELDILARTFEEGADAESAKMVSIHANSIMSVIKKLSVFKTHVSDFDNKISSGFHETNSVDEGILKSYTYFGNPQEYGLIFKGPQFTIGNPWYKTPQSVCNNQFNYDVVNLSNIEQDFFSRSNFKPAMPIEQFKTLIEGFEQGQDSKGNTIKDNWIDYYKLAFRSQLSQPQERTLICAVLPRRTAHINAVISVAFRHGYDCVDMAALCSSLVLDFFIKTTGAGGLFPSRMLSFPLGVADVFKSALYSRTLLLNCLTTAYADLWHEMWNEEYKAESWSIEDPRLKPFDKLHDEWAWDIPLRNYFERRMALVEIDVISAMALGLTLEDLEMIYTIQFPVLQQNENDTWYDANGNIVFTCSKGLTGVGLDRKKTGKSGLPGWEDIRGEEIKDIDGKIIGYKGIAPTHIHTIDPAKSELYGGQQVTYYAPYTRCDRIADYRTAWAHFEKIFNK